MGKRGLRVNKVRRSKASRTLERRIAKLANRPVTVTKLPAGLTLGEMRRRHAEG